MGVVCWIKVQPPERFGVSPSATPMRLKGRFSMIVIVDNSRDKILSNSELAIIVGAIFAALGIVLIPF